MNKVYLQLAFIDKNCDAAFTFYEMVFNTRRLMTMRWDEAPPEVVHPVGDENLILRTGIELGNLTLMGADAHPGRGKPFGGFTVTIDSGDEDEVKRVFAALSEGGKVMMPLGPTFWSPLFGGCVDKFGIEWMIGVQSAEG